MYLEGIVNSFVEIQSSKSPLQMQVVRQSVCLQSLYCGI